MPSTIKINRAPVLTLWAAIVAERLGFDHDEALTLGRALAGLNAQSKGRRLGIFEPSAETIAEKKKDASPDQFDILLMGRAVPAVMTKDGIRAVDKGKPSDPATAEKYLKSKFRDELATAERAMAELAKSFPPKTLAAEAYKLYMEFRPKIPEGIEGWGAAGTLDLEVIAKLKAPR